MYYDNSLPRGTVTYIPAVRGGLGFTTTDMSGGGTGGSIATSAANVAGAFVGLPGFGTIITTIANFVGIGKGRREADQIVPTQNQLGDFLAQVSAYIPTATSAADLQVVANQLSQAWTAFQSFIFNKNQFPDGRASQQAYNDLAPLVQGFQAGIADKMRQLGGTPGALTLMQGAGTPRLSTSTYGFPQLPQAGILNRTPPQGVLQAGFLGSGPILPLLLAGGVGMFLFRKKV